MNKKKTWVDIHKDEVFTDNSKIENCKQCKNCRYKYDGTVWSNNYEKCHCQKYPYPNNKPIDVIDNKADCPFFTKE